MTQKPLLGAGVRRMSRMSRMRRMTKMSRMRRMRRISRKRIHLILPSPALTHGFLRNPFTLLRKSLLLFKGIAHAFKGNPYDLKGKALNFDF